MNTINLINDVPPPVDKGWWEKLKEAKQIAGDVELCPFCGNEARLYIHMHDDSLYVRCVKCSAKSADVHSEYEHQAKIVAGLWNKRAGVDGVHDALMLVGELSEAIACGDNTIDAWLSIKLIELFEFVEGLK